LSSLLLPPFLRAEHYHQHTHTHEHNLNILTPTNSSLLNGNALVGFAFSFRQINELVFFFRFKVRQIIKIRQ